MVKVTAEPDVPEAVGRLAAEIMERRLAPHGLSEVRVWAADGEDGGALVIVEVGVPPAPFSHADSPAVRAQVDAQFELFQRVATVAPGVSAEVRLRGANTDCSTPERPAA